MVRPMLESVEDRMRIPLRLSCFFFIVISPLCWSVVWGKVRNLCRRWGAIANPECRRPSHRPGFAPTMTHSVETTATVTTTEPRPEPVTAC